jgi:hypothetical protein
MLHAVHHAVSYRFDRCEEWLLLKPAEQHTGRGAMVAGGKPARDLGFAIGISDDQIRASGTDAIDHAAKM